MLEKLGEGLRAALRKIAGAGYIDKATVDELARDIQRTLLAADVDVKLVFQLTEAIKKRALEEKPKPGISAREHLVRIVYEELVKFVGKKPEILLKPHKILFIGLYGSGKCIHPRTSVPLADGTTLTAEELYNRYKSREEPDTDGFVVPLNDGELNIHAMNEELKIQQASVAALWRLAAPPQLVRVELDNGLDHNVITTPEHPFFVLDSLGIRQVRADEVAPGMQIAVPNKLHSDGKIIDLFDLLFSQPGHWCVYDLQIAAAARSSAKEHYGTLQAAHRALKIGCHYTTFTHLLKHGQTPLALALKVCSDMLCQRSELVIRRFVYPNASRKSIKVPRYLTPELAEWLGYLIGEGNIDRESIIFYNSSIELLERFRHLSVLLFGMEPHKKVYDRCPALVLSSTVLLQYLKQLFGLTVGAKSATVVVPTVVELSPLTVIRAFLRAIMDGEGYIAPSTRHAEISSASRKMIVQLGTLLLRLGILPTYSRKCINGQLYWRLFIHGRYLERLANEVQLLIPYKQAALERAKIIGAQQGPGSQEMFVFGALLKHVREAFGVSIGEMERYVNSYGIYENRGKISRDSLRGYIKALEQGRSWLPILERISNGSPSYKKLCDIAGSRGRLNPIIRRLTQLGYIEEFGGQLAISRKGQALLNGASAMSDALSGLRRLAEADVSWITVRNVTVVVSDTPYVYDLTVPQLHNFVAGNTIIHNTTSIGKLARFYQKKGLKVALVGCDVHRPAAMTQLEQIASQLGVPVHAPKDIKDPYKVAATGAEQFAKKYDVLIFDASGRSALDPELAAELKKLGEIIKADEVLLTIPADLGQAAGPQAKAFKELVGITGIFLTKMDATARGGGAITACAVTGAPVKFIGTGEKLEAIEVFDPERFISRLIGFGDLQSLLEKAREAEFRPEAAEAIMAGKFTMGEFYEQIKAMQKMGPLKGVLEAMPGMGMMKLPKEFDPSVMEGKMKKWKYMIESMTKAEKADPDTIDSSRIKRIAKGSGTSENEVRELLKYYAQIKKMTKMLAGGGLKRGPLAALAKKFKGFG